MKQRTPQEKKALSYIKDRRNAYGENDKASRRIIPLRKAKSHRSYRKTLNDILHKSLILSEPEDIEAVENKVKSIRKNAWKKWPDMPLGKFVERKLNHRKTHVNKGKTARKKIRDIIENLEIKIEQGLNNWTATATNHSNLSGVGKTPEIAVEKLKYLAKAAVSNSLGFDHQILVDGKFIKPVL